MAQEREETTMSGQLLSCTQSLRWLLPVVMASALLGCGTYEGARLPPSAEYPADAKIALLLPPMDPERGTSQFVSDAAKAISAGFWRSTNRTRLRRGSFSSRWPRRMRPAPSADWWRAFTQTRNQSVAPRWSTTRPTPGPSV